MTEVHVPVLNVGFDASTFITRRVRDLVPGGAADRAGLEEGDMVELPSYSQALALNAHDALNIRVTRDGETRLVTLPFADQTTTPVPQWHKPGSIGG